MKPWVLPGPLPCGRYLLALLTGDKERSMGLIILRVKPTPTRFPTNSLYTPMDNTPLHSISSVCHPWGENWCCCWNVFFKVQHFPVLKLWATSLFYTMCKIGIFYTSQLACIPRKCVANVFWSFRLFLTFFETPLDGLHCIIVRPTLNWPTDIYSWK